MGLSAVCSDLQKQNYSFYLLVPQRNVTGDTVSVQEQIGPDTSPNEMVCTQTVVSSHRLSTIKMKL